MRVNHTAHFISIFYSVAELPALSGRATYALQDIQHCRQQTTRHVYYGKEGVDSGRIDGNSNGEPCMAASPLQGDNGLPQQAAVLAQH